MADPGAIFRGGQTSVLGDQIEKNRENITFFRQNCENVVLGWGRKYTTLGFRRGHGPFGPLLDSPVDAIARFTFLRLCRLNQNYMTEPETQAVERILLRITPSVNHLILIRRYIHTSTELVVLELCLTSSALLKFRSIHAPPKWYS